MLDSSQSEEVSILSLQIHDLYCFKTDLDRPHTEKQHDKEPIANNNTGQRIS